MSPATCKPRASKSLWSPHPRPDPHNSPLIRCINSCFTGQEIKFWKVPFLLCSDLKPGSYLPYSTVCPFPLLPGPLRNSNNIPVRKPARDSTPHTWLTHAALPQQKSSSTRLQLYVTVTFLKCSLLYTFSYFKIQDIHVIHMQQTIQGDLTSGKI